MKQIFIWLFFNSIVLLLQAQPVSNLRSHYIPVSGDTIRIDTLSIVPGSCYLLSADLSVPDTSAYRLLETPAGTLLIWKDHSAINADSIKIFYRVFPFLLSSEYSHKSRSLIYSGSTLSPFSYSPEESRPQLFRVQGLNHTGSISRGISFGNNQDVFVNSSLNLQLSGKLSDNVEILAAITDENIPVQPEGNTQQLQDFDKVFIQVSDANNTLIAGDFELKRPDSYFMNFFKKNQGGIFTTSFSLARKKNPEKKRIMKTGVSAAVSKGKFARNTITAIEGNQGPYKLQGTDGETYLVVLSGTEKVYIDGQLMTRGVQDDYTIDYNTAEITFTAKRFITKDSRIIVDFEYSEKSYARSLLYFNNEFESEKLHLKFNAYSEQDSKNQPLQLDLDSSKKALMAGVGDSIQLAFFPTADSVAFNSGIVLYQKKDTTVASGTYSIFLYSTKADSAYWQVSFSEVGFGKGDYVQDLSSANGRVFKWVEPLNNSPQGNYAPVTLLITPKKQQLFTLGADYLFNNRNKLSIETAMSNNDVNLFSSKGNADNLGYATRILYKNFTVLSGDSAKGWGLSSNISYEYSGKNFRPIERYRNVEFERDWNLGASSVYNDEHTGIFQTTLIRNNTGSLTYSLKTYNKGEDYRGIMNTGGLNLNRNGFVVSGNISSLQTKGILQKTNYLRHSADISRSLWKLVIGIGENSENNRFYSTLSDTLSAASYSFRELSGYISNSDSSRAHARLSVKDRIDKLPFGAGLVSASKSDEATLLLEFMKNPANSLRTTTTYRVLNILDTTLSRQEAAKNLLNRLEHSLSLWDGILTAGTYYEVGTGLERKQEYFYLEVPAGQGVYAYIGDLNNNGVKDLDEFAVSSFTDEAKYIRVFTPTNTYITTHTNQFSEVLSISPAGTTPSYQGKLPFIHRLYNQLSFRLEKKVKDQSLLASLNPFSRNIDDSLLLSSNSSFRNTLFFNRMNPVFGLDITFQQNQNKSLLTNGFESRQINSEILNIRWNFSHAFLFNAAYQNDNKKNFSGYFSSRNYRILSDMVEPKITYQPGTSFRVSAGYRFQKKENKEGTGGEKAVSHRLSLESKFTSVNSFSLNGKLSLVEVEYNGEANSLLAYEMLDGLKNGRNYTWNLSLQRSLSNAMQISLSYDGRKLQDSPVVHTGSVQFRAFF